MRIKIRLFSVAKDLAGFDQREIDLPHIATTDDVMKFLEKQNERFLDWKSSLRFAVNYEYVPNDHPLNDGDEVAIIPPVSGG